MMDSGIEVEKEGKLGHKKCESEKMMGSLDCRS